MDGTAPVREPAETLAVDPWLPAAEQADGTPQVVPKNTTPTPLTCENVAESITVTTMKSGVICNGVDTSGLSLLAGFLDGVNIEGELDFGAQVCFREQGLLIFLDMSGATPRLMELLAYQVSSMTCGWLDQPGTVVLVASSLPVSQVDSDVAATFVPLSDCQVETSAGVNFRAAPAGDSLDVVIPFGTRLTATAKSSGLVQCPFR